MKIIKWSPNRDKTLKDGPALTVKRPGSPDTFKELYGHGMERSSETTTKCIDHQKRNVPFET